MGGVTVLTGVTDGSGATVTVGVAGAVAAVTGTVELAAGAVVAVAGKGAVAGTDVGMVFSVLPAGAGETEGYSTQTGLTSAA